MLTRPAHQAAALGQRIEQLGGELFPFPVMEIIPPRDIAPALALFQDLSRFDIAIFISANAARIGLKIMSQESEIPNTLLFATVGLATARALEEQGHTADIIPDGQFDSEGLLATPQLQQIRGKKIVIIRGEGGRELLADTLRERGAEVSYAETYRRIIPQTDPAPIIDGWKDNRIHAAIITSNQSLSNLMQMVGDEGKPFLLKTPLVVISERTREVAKELGFQTEPMLAQPPSDDAILDTLIHWATAEQ